MGNGFSAMLEPLQSVVKSVGDGLKDIKLPDNPFKDVSLGNRVRNFGKGLGSGLMGPKQVRVQVSTGPLGLGRATQLRSVSSTPLTAFGLLGDFAGNKIGRMGRTGTKPIFSSTTPSLVERMKQKFKRIKTTNTTNTTNIGNIELSNMSRQPQPPQEIQQAGKKKKSSKKEKYPSKKEKTSSKKEKNPSKKKTKSKK